jgi:hypothetical protein
MRHQSLKLVGRNFKLEGIAFSPHSQVALNPTLCIQDQIPRASIRDQIAYGVCYHPAEPTETILAPNSDPMHPTKIVRCGSLRQGRYFFGSSVQLMWGEHTPEFREPGWAGRGSQLRCKRGGNCG